MITGMTPETIVTIKALLAGAAGGTVRWIALKEGWRDGTGSIICGSLMALFVGPALVPLWSLGGLVEKSGMSQTQTVLMSGFMTGVCGILITGFIIDLFKARTAKLKGKEDREK